MSGQDTQLEHVQAAIDAHASRPGALLPLLHEVQERLGHIPESSVPVIAKALNLSRAEVHGVVTFYHHFRESRPGAHVIQICRAEACQAVGANQLIAHAETSLQCGLHHTCADRSITLEPVYCLGQCAVGPAIAVNDKPYAMVNAQKFDAIIQQIRSAQ